MKDTQGQCDDPSHRGRRGCIERDLAELGLDRFRPEGCSAWRQYRPDEWTTLFAGLSAVGRVDLLDEPRPRLIFFRDDRPWLMLRLIQTADACTVVAAYAEAVGESAGSTIAIEAGIATARDGSSFAAEAPRTREPIAAFEQPVRLSTQAQDEAAVLAKNDGLIPWVAQQYGLGTGEEVLQSGRIGLLLSYRRFDPARGTLATYAVPRIRDEIKRALVHSGSFIPSTQYAILRRADSRGDVAAFASSEATLARRATSIARASSLDALVGENSPATLGALLADPAADPGAACLIADLGEQITQVVNDELDARSRSILEQHFGLAGRPPRTLQSIGDDLGISRERVRQIEHTAMRRLRLHPSVAALGAANGLEWVPPNRPATRARASLPIVDGPYVVAIASRADPLDRSGPASLGIAGRTPVQTSGTFWHPARESRVA